MIPVITVHWQGDRWVDLQLKFIEENINDDYKVLYVFPVTGLAVSASYGSHGCAGLI
jgi:hypothetical protein